MLGYSSGHYRRARPEVLWGVAERALALVASEEVRVRIAGSFSLRDAAAAHDLLESRATLGKLLLAPLEDL